MTSNLQNNVFQTNNMVPPPPVFQVQQGPTGWSQPAQLPGMNMVPQQFSNAYIAQQQSIQQPIQQNNSLFGAPQQIHGGFYGRRSQQAQHQVKQPDVFNDD